jgi:hypothetical protein
MSEPIFIVRIPRRDFLGEPEMLDKLRRDLKNQRLITLYYTKNYGKDN